MTLRAVRKRVPQYKSPSRCCRSASKICSALASIGSSADLCTLREANSGGWVIGEISRILIVTSVTCRAFGYRTFDAAHSLGRCELSSDGMPRLGLFRVVLQDGADV